MMNQHTLVEKMFINVHVHFDVVQITMLIVIDHYKRQVRITDTFWMLFNILQ